MIPRRTPRRFGQTLAALASVGIALSLPISGALARVIPGSADPAVLLAQLRVEYEGAFPSHNSLAAAHVRGMSAAANQLAAQSRGSGAAPLRAQAAQLQHDLAATSFALEIWPEPDAINHLVSSISRELGAADLPQLSVAAAQAQLNRLTATARSDSAAGRAGASRAAIAEGYAVFASDVAPRLSSVAPELVTATERDQWLAFGSKPGNRAVAITRIISDLNENASSLGEIKVSRATIVTDAAIILFREGLEAVLILAAITASFTGERRRLRRPVMIGAGVGLLATAVTYVLAQAIVDALGDGGLRLQAITGLIAIAVLLVVTNWFFHRVYWSEWIARFNRRRKALEQVERSGFISGQTLGLVTLGLTSVYREGFETVLFLQNLQVSAGTGATLLGVAIGLGATLIVGTMTFALGRKLPYKRMLIVTGVMIGLVLAVMVGTTVNNLQGLGWLPSNGIGLTVDPRISQWLGLYATWEGVCAQVAALLVVYGSYVLARQIQLYRRRRAISTEAAFALSDGQATAPYS